MRGDDDRDPLNATDSAVESPISKRRNDPTARSIISSARLVIRSRHITSTKGRDIRVMAFEEGTIHGDSNRRRCDADVEHHLSVRGTGAQLVAHVLCSNGG